MKKENTPLALRDASATLSYRTTTLLTVQSSNVRVKHVHPQHYCPPYAPQRGFQLCPVRAHPIHLEMRGQQVTQKMSTMIIRQKKKK